MVEEGTGVDSATEGRRRDRKIGFGIVAASAAMLVGGSVLSTALNPPFEPQYTAPEFQPPRVASSDPVMAAPENTDFTTVVDVTDEVSSMFSGDLIDVRSQVQTESATTIEMVTDRCLWEWAAENLEAFAVDGVYEVMTVCGRPTAVLAGPAGADTKVLAYGALEATAPEGMRQLLAESTSDQMSFVAMRTSDDEAQLLAVAVPDEG